MIIKLNGEFVHSLVTSHSKNVQDLVGKKKSEDKPVSCVSRTTFDKAFTEGILDSNAKLVCDQLADYFQKAFRHPPLTYRDLIDPQWLIDNPDAAATLRYLDWQAGSGQQAAPAFADDALTDAPPSLPLSPTRRSIQKRWIAATAAACVLIFGTIALLIFTNGESKARLLHLPEINFSLSAVRVGTEEPLPIENAKLPLKAGDSVQFHARASEPCYFYLFWLDALGKSTPVWPWKDLTWDPGISTEPVNAFRFPEGRTYFELQPDTTGIHAVILFASRTPIKDLDALRNYLESLGYRQTGLTTINSQLLAVIENGLLVRAHDRSPLRDDRKKHATSATSILQTKLPPPFLPKDIAVTSICFAFEGEPSN